MANPVVFNSEIEEEGLPRASAPALGARYIILSIPFPALLSILFNKLGNLLLVQRYLQWPQPHSQMHSSGTAAHLPSRAMATAC
jgi:hypothetical protein